MTPVTHGWSQIHEQALHNARQDAGDGASPLTRLLERAQRAALHSQHISSRMRSAILRHAGTSPPRQRS